MVTPIPPTGRKARADEKERIRAIMQTDSVDDARLRFVVAEDGADYASGCWRSGNATEGWLTAVAHEGRVRVDLLYAVTQQMVEQMIAARLGFIRFEIYDRALRDAVARDFDAEAYFSAMGTDTETGQEATWLLRMDLLDARARLARWFAQAWRPVP